MILLDLHMPCRRQSCVNPNLTETLEKKNQNSKLAETYHLLLEIGDIKRLCIGIKSLPEADFEALKENLMEKLCESDCENAAPVELTPEQEDAATYLFRISGNWEGFL